MRYTVQAFSAKQFFSVFHKYSRGKKSICESNSLRGLRQMKMLFFLNPPHLTQEVFACFLLLLLSLSLSTYLSFSFFTFDLNSDIQVCPRMSVTNCSPTLWQCFFSSRAFYDLLFFLFLFFFSVFSLSRSGAPDVKRPRYGFIPFLFWFCFF